jgi:hypothetical protein
MSVPFDDGDIYQGMAQDLLGITNAPGQVPGLGSSLVEGTQASFPSYTPSPQFVRDALLTLKAQDLQGKQATSPGAASIRVPTLAPPSVANNFPQQAVLPGMRNPSNSTDESMLQSIIDSQRPDLGLEGNLIRGFLPEGLSKDAFENYWLAKGPMQLSDARFQDIVNTASKLIPSKPTAVTSINGEPLIRKQFDLYGTKTYKDALGTASVFYSPDGKPVGFYDYYNFDNNPNKNRSRLTQREIRAMSVLGPLHGAKDFPLYYGEYAPPN